jgi:capsid protein
MTILDHRGQPAGSSNSRPTVSAREIRAYYEGARGNNMRSSLPGIIQEARRDLARYTRRELLRISRYLWKNNPLAKAVTERLVTYTVGTGIRPEPASSDEKWNRRAAIVFEEWAKRADLTSRQSFWKLQEIAFRSTLVDGDVFVIKTFGDSGRPRIQLLEADQVGTPNMSGVLGKNDDGIIADRNGRPVTYVAQERDSSNTFRERRIPADAVVHMANIERPGQGRGAPVAAAALTTAVDLHDILGMEKACVKDAATKTDIIKTESGELPPDESVIGRSMQASSGQDSEETVVEYYKQVFGPQAKILKRGDEFTPYIPARPSPAWAGFVDFLAELICLSYNLPPSLVRQIKVGGADTRRDLATMQRVAEVWQATLAQQWQLVYEYVIEAEIEDGALSGAPSDWRLVDWQFPRAPTVDAGRAAQQDREDVRTGNMTLREARGQFGEPWRKHVRQLGVEMKEIIDTEKEFDLPAGSLVQRLYGGPNGTGVNLPGQVPATPAAQ